LERREQIDQAHTEELRMAELKEKIIELERQIPENIKRNKK
jgi:hypothetical protein